MPQSQLSTNFCQMKRPPLKRPLTIAKPTVKEIGGPMRTCTRCLPLASIQSADQIAVQY